MNKHAQRAIEKLLCYGLCHGLISPLDVPYARNGLLDILGLQAPLQDCGPPDEEVPDTATPILAELMDCAAGTAALAEDTPDARERLDTRLMGCLMPRPSQVLDVFLALREREGVRAATDWFYRLNRHSNYIRVDQVAKNRRWFHEDPRYGKMEVTINLSKPEKDPRDIARLQSQPAGGYPRCLLCPENVGYAGRPGHPARQTLRMLPLVLDGAPWYFQYSPYVYYDQHCIVLGQEHTPMHIDAHTFRRLTEFTTLFPHYFIGSNADLPIVGGSILNHDHFQGGAYELPMARAADAQALIPPEGFDGSAAILRWPMSVLRLTGCCRDALVLEADRVLAAWRAYDDPDAGILCRAADGTPHSTLTPIARRRSAAFQLDLVLRNNRTSPERPLGIFHPRPSLHPIKKENIGLIEVMGLFILPGRLQAELTAVAAILSGAAPFDRAALTGGDHPLGKHLPWIETLRDRYGAVAPDEAAQILEREVGALCVNVLEDAGVYKDTDEGRAGFLRFLTKLGYRPAP